MKINDVFVIGLLILLLFLPILCGVTAWCIAVSHVHWTIALIFSIAICLWGFLSIGGRS